MAAATKKAKDAELKVKDQQRALTKAKKSKEQALKEKEVVVGEVAATKLELEKVSTQASI